MIKQSDKDILNKYAEIKKDIKALEAQCDELNPQVVEIMRTSEVEEIAISDLGKLSMASRRTWIYSKKLQDTEKQLKADKKIEEQTGKADYKESHYVIFKTIKEE